MTPHVIAEDALGDVREGEVVAREAFKTLCCCAQGLLGEDAYEFEGIAFGLGHGSPIGGEGVVAVDGGFGGYRCWQVVVHNDIKGKQTTGFGDIREGEAEGGGGSFIGLIEESAYLLV